MLEYLLTIIKNFPFYDQNKSLQFLVHLSTVKKSVINRVTRFGYCIAKFWLFLGSNGLIFWLFFKNILIIFAILKHLGVIFAFLAIFDNFWLFLKNHIRSLCSSLVIYYMYNNAVLSASST